MGRRLESAAEKVAAEAAVSRELSGQNQELAQHFGLLEGAERLSGSLDQQVSSAIDALADELRSQQQAVDARGEENRRRIGELKEQVRGEIRKVEETLSAAGRAKGMDCGGGAAALELACTQQLHEWNDLLRELDDAADLPSGAAAGDTAVGELHRRCAAQEIRSQSLSWRTGLSLQERNAVTVYTAAGYADINSFLRGFSSAYLYEGNRVHSENLHAALSRARTDAEVVAYRGIGQSGMGGWARLSDEELVGRFVYDKGFVSTSLSRSGAFGGATLLEIQVPRGSRGVYVGDISAVGKHEDELLLDRGQAFRITGVRREGGRRIVSVRVLN